MSVFKQNIVTFEQLMEILKKMNNEGKIDTIYAEECMGGSWEIFVSAKDEEV